jgi:hypothetical protein
MFRGGREIYPAILFGLSVAGALGGSANTSISDFIPQLADLTVDPPYTRPIRLGGQNFTHCCLRALNDSLSVRDGALIYQTPSFVNPDTNVSELRAAAQQDFPCGATFNGNYDGAPVISVPYEWCGTNCDGWQISHRDVPSQWIGPTVGFILPCLAFVLNIPRSWKTQIPKYIWQMKPTDTMQLLSYSVQMPLALLVVTIDVTIWLSICFAFAGPMFLSAAYEAIFDHKLLGELERVAREHPAGSLSQELRAKLLCVVLVGNIKLPKGQQLSNDSIYIPIRLLMCRAA